MKRRLYLTDIKFLPAITEEDKDFAIKVHKEYEKIPFDELCWLIRDVRNEIQEDLFELKECSNLKASYKKYSEKLFSSDVEIKYLSITTNKGTIKIKSSDIIFNYFTVPLQRVKKKFEKQIKSESEWYKKMAKRLPFNKIVIYFLNSDPLGEFQKRVAIGMFLVHFKLSKGNPIMTEANWIQNPTEALSYKHYLSDIVKIRIKKNYKEFSNL